MLNRDWPDEERRTLICGCCLTPFTIIDSGRYEYEKIYCVECGADEEAPDDNQTMDDQP